MIFKKSHNRTNQKQGLVYIGVTVTFFCHDGKGRLLLHKRSKNNRDEHNVWDVGGGAMEFGETFEQAVRREVREEYGADILKLDFIAVNNVLRNHKGKKSHWVAIIFAAKVNPKKVKIGEPVKMDAIGWFYPKNLPNPRHSKLDEHLNLVLSKKVI